MVNQNHLSPNASEITSVDDRNLMSIAQYLKDTHQRHKRSIPPLDQWQPKHCGQMNLIIKANGEWWHEGQRIKRQSLVDLFSTVLWTENQKFYLKTPVEQIEIEVEDAPLLIEQIDQVEIEKQCFIQLITTNQDVVLVDHHHPIFMREFRGALRPYAHIRFGLNALIPRAAFYHLIEMGNLLSTADGQTILQLKSGDCLLQLES